MIKVDRFFDIETEDWDTFVMGGVVDSDGDYKCYTWEREVEFFYDLVDKGGAVWAHNGGMYDFLWFLQIAADERVKCTISMAGSRITRLQCGSLTLRDSYALAPFSLLKLCDILSPSLKDELWGGTPHKETGLPCICGESCGGYCCITRDMSEDSSDALSWYLEKDCRAGLAIMSRLVREAEECKYELTGTVGGSSYKSAAIHCDLEKPFWRHTQHYTTVRAAYYGGRTEVFRPSCSDGYRYDIHSAYPAALKDLELPTGAYLALPRAKAAKAYYREREGVWTARVHVPLDMHIPPLPFRLPDGRVSFPIGPMSGTWTGLELRYAESLGCDVDIRTGLVWTDAECIFAEWMRKIWANRGAAESESKTLAKWHKWFANSLTGKFAQNPKGQKLIACPDPDDIRLCGGAKGEGGRECWGQCSPSHCCDHQCSGRCGAWKILDKQGRFFQSDYWRLPDCGHIHWAAYLTAHTRIQVHAMLTANDAGESAVYCDTDSCYAQRVRVEGIGDELGEWGLEGVMRDFLALAPKTYRYQDDNGKEIIRAKGLSGITPRDFQRFIDGGAVSRDRGVKGLRSALRSNNGIFARKLITRSNKQDGLHFGSRILGGAGKTYPQTVKDLRKWQAQRHESN